MASSPSSKKIVAEKAQCAAEAVPHLEDDWTITVCDACNRAGCWQGEIYCGDYKRAGTKDITIGEAKALNVEHPTWWTKDTNAIRLLLKKGVYA